MPDTTITDHAAERARALYTGEGLPFPPLPPRLAEALDEVEPNVFATRPLETGPYALEIHSLEAQSAPAAADYAVIGFDGHGSNSWAVHYFRVAPGLALFIQLPWGGAYVDPDEARAEIVAAYGWAAKLQETVAGAVASGTIPAGWRLLVVDSEFADAGWAWIGPAAGAEAVDLTRARDVRTAVDAVLTDLLSGKTRLG